MLRRVQSTKAYTRVVQCSCCLASSLMLLTLGCMSASTTRKASSLKSAKNITSSAPELSSRNRSLLALYSAEIETAADKVISESNSSAAQRQALEWKAEAIPEMQTALLNPDPVAAVLDTWAFIFQMTAYMERPASKQRMGKSYPVVVATLRNMEAEMEQLILMAAPTANVADLRQRVGAWAEAHPIQAGLNGRQSVDPDVIRKVGQSDLGIKTSIKTLAEGLGDLSARLDSYNVYLPKQARWQAELLLTDFTHDPQISSTLSNIALISDSAKEATSSIDRMPDLVNQTREVLTANIASQRLSAQAFIEEERLKTLFALQQERITTMAAMDGERLAATADFREERKAALETLRGQEIAVMNEFEAFSAKTIQDLDAEGRGLIDYLFLRVLELMLLMMVLCAVVAWVLLRQFLRNTIARANPL
jgi:hypothetical protein